VGEANNGNVHAIEKPFRLHDFMLQVTRIINRPHDVTIGVHKLHVNVRQMEFADGRIVMLTEKEVGILLHLALARAPVPRDVLLHEVWGYHPDATTHTLETHIYRLRQKIEKDPEKPAFLVTTEAGYALA
jgi:DNA-binding response OmpR family regulator